jgi:hypothetical protein
MPMAPTTATMATTMAPVTPRAARPRTALRYVTPPNTWQPWNPVRMKNVAPKLFRLTDWPSW